MRHVYVASHGPFARGLINSLSLLIGDEHGVTPVCAYDGDIVTTEQLEQTLENLIAQANGEKWWCLPICSAAASTIAPRKC